LEQVHATLAKVTSLFEAMLLKIIGSKGKRNNWTAPFIVVLLAAASDTSCMATTPPSVTNQKPIELRGITKNLALPIALDEALMNSPRTDAIRRQLGITKSNLIRATELPNPTLFMDNGYRAEFTYRYGVTAPIEMPWKLALRIILAKNQIKQTDREILKSLWYFRATVRRAYTELIVAQELYVTLSELADLTDKLHKTTQKRLESGDVAELDVYRAEQASVKALAEKERQFYKVREAQQSLAVLLGRVVADPLTVPRLPPEGQEPMSVGILPADDSAFPTLETCLTKAMEFRPEIKVIKQAMKTNSANMKLAVGNILPNPVLGMGSSVVNGPGQSPSAAASSASTDSSGTPTFQPPPDNNFHGFFFQVFQEVPIFNFQQGDISLYRATAKQLKSELMSQENIVTQDVATSYQRLLAARKKIEIYRDRLLARTFEIVKLARLGYEVGQADINAVLLAQQSAIEIKTEYLTAVAEYQAAFTDLEQSIGTPLQ